MRALLLLALVSLTASAQSPRFSRFCSRTDQGRTSRGLLCDEGAFFEAFNGRGTTTACSTTAPTGAKGEVLTFTRASAATCTKTASGGLATTGIANGDLVSLSNDVARVSFDSASTLGLLVEASRQNLILRSESFDDAVWVKQQAGGRAVPTVTANFDTAPDGTTTADRVVFDSCASIGTESILTQNPAAGGAWQSIYLRGTSGAGSISLCSYIGPVGQECTVCSFVSGSWTRCSRASGASGGQWALGCENQTAFYTNATNTGTADVLLWGAQHEVGAYATSYIRTTGSAVTRVAETATFPGSTFPVSPVSFAASVTVPWAGTTTAADILYGNASSTSGLALGWTGATLRAQMCSGSCNTLDVAQGPVAGVTARWAYQYSSGSASTFRDGSVIAGPTVHTAAASPWATAVGVGCNGFGAVNGIISRICVDPSPTRCR